MCGISGIVSKIGSPISKERIRKITDIVAHRGPDDEGFYFGDNIALGHRRLSIIDLNIRGRQPMCFRGRYWITYNGEIYNYLEIRAELEKSGVAFRTTTDTEVVLAAYAVWGTACLSKFNGMWAFAIYDCEEGTIFVARDRFGVKPLYYMEESDEFVFGSEIKQLLMLQTTVRANQHVVVEALLTRFEGHTDETYFSGIKALPQAHYMMYRMATHSYTLHQYYSLAVQKAGCDLSLDDSVASFKHLFESSVRLRLRSDVRVGTCLSGGLDSSATSAVAARLYRLDNNKPFLGIHAKSVEQSSDESSFAKMVAHHIDLDLKIVEPSIRDFVNTIDEVVYTQEEPFGSPSMFMGWHVFQRAHAESCKVMLNGQGGDEVLVGYERYFAAFLLGLSVPEFFRQLYLQSANSKLRLREVLQYYLYFTNASVRIRRLKSRSHLRRHIKDGHDFSFVEKSVNSFRSIESLQIFEISTLQLPHLLRYEDRNSMRHSIETRLPFLDYRLVEAVISMPNEYKIRNGWTKYILRGAIGEALPKSIAWRRDKLGFEAPTKTWLGAYEENMKNEISKSRILREIADVRRILDKYSKLSLKERWAYFNLAVWERVYGVSWE